MHYYDVNEGRTDWNRVARRSGYKLQDGGGRLTVKCQTDLSRKRRGHLMDKGGQNELGRRAATVTARI